MMKNCYLFILLCCLSMTLHAQDNLLLKGKVTDSYNQAIGGATLSLTGSNQRTSTRDDGSFSLEYTRGATLTVSYIGYKTLAVELTNQKEISLQLESVSEEIDQVVVIGYGTRKKGEITSSVASVKSEDFNKGAVKDAGQLLQGKVAGLRITTPNGDPTASTQINLRGMASIAGSADPLVIVDGVPGSLNSVAPEDIESVDVMKDGSAAAIYGTRATGGVIFITTRQNRSHENRATVEYNNYASLQTLFRTPELLTASDYRRLIAEGQGYTDYGYDTDWIKEVTQQPFSHNHNLTLFGGNAKTNYTGSVNYRDWEGVLLKSGQQRLNIRADLNHQMFDGKLRTHIQVINNSRKALQGGSSEYMWRQALIRNPTDRIYNDEGGWEERDIYMYDNPLGMIHETVNDGIFRESRMNGSVDYRPIEALSLKAMVSRVQDNNLTGTSTSFDHVNTVKNKLNGTASRWTQAGVENLMELTANYNKTFGDHKLDVLGGYSWQRNQYENFYAYNFNFPTAEYSYNNLGAGLALKNGLAAMTSYKAETTLIGFFGRVSYNYKQKYMAMASLRREGSSTFGENHRWGNFPAVSLAWDLAKEDFLSESTAIDQLKFRTGVGVTGTIAGAPYQSQISYDYTLDQGAYINGEWVPGLVPARNFNPDLRWEKKVEYNVGVDYGLFSNRLSGSLDYYTRRVKDLLYHFQVPTPPYLVESMMINAGEMSNSGFEALVNVNVLRERSFKWNTSFVFSTNTNKLINLSNNRFGVAVEYFNAGYTGEPIQVSTHRVQVGEPIGRFFVHKSVGIDDEGKWLVENKDGEIIPVADATPEDRQYYGNGIPKYNLGWNNSFQYKQFDLNLNWRGALGFQILNMGRLYYENPVNKGYNALKTAYDPIYGQVLNNSLVYVSHYIEDGDYLKLDNLTFGYTFKPNAIKGVSNLRLYVSGMNLLTITGYKGLDPEATSYSGDFLFAPGIEHRDRYPTTRTFTAGLNVSF